MHISETTGRLVLTVATIATVLSTLSSPGDAQRRQPTPEQRARMMEQLQQQLKADRPIPAPDTIWIEDMTWMEVRDAMADGKTTVLVTSGGVEQNGPYLVTGKHNVILKGTCEAIARALGDALCAPVIKLVPEGNIDPPSGHMMFPGTLSVREETYQAMLTDVASSLAAHGFEHIVFLGDSGGNQRGMATVAEALNTKWTGGDSRVHYIPEYYRYEELFAWSQADDGLGIEEPVNEGLHDNYPITAMMMVIDPTSVRYDERKATGKASINGVALDPVDETLEAGRKLIDKKVDEAVAAIRASIAGSSE